MCQSLTEAILPKKPKIPITCTVSSNPDTEDPDIKDVVLNLPNFEVLPIDDFDTIDENLLAQLVQDTEKQQEIDNQTDQNKQKDTEVMQVPRPPLSVRPTNVDITYQNSTQNNKVTQNKSPILSV